MRNISVKFGPVFKKMSLKDISHLELCDPFIWPSKTLCAILVEAIMRNISVKLF